MRKKSLILFFLMSFVSLQAQKNLNLIPLPQDIKESGSIFLLNKHSVIFSNHTDNAFNIDYLLEKINPIFLFDIPVVKQMPSSNFIFLDLSASYDLPDESYSLSISDKGVTIKASSKSGIFYGIQTFLQLFPTGVYSGEPMRLLEYEVEGVVISDNPRYSYRGFMLDVSRTFYELDYVIMFIDWMAYHKLNTLHWHLVDDNGWRIEIKKYPKLTSVGAWRGRNMPVPASYNSGNDKYGGFYTQKEIAEVIKYAADRNIEIIPEIDLPGHSRAAVASYPEIMCDVGNTGITVNGEKNNVWCVGREENYKMLDNILKEIAALFPSKYLHIGGDEVLFDAWSRCPVCQELMKREGMKNETELQNYFVRRLEKIVTKHGKIMGGWDEILEGGESGPDTRIWAWRNMKTAKQSISMKKNTVVVVAEYYYFDMKYTPKERGHQWAAIIPLEKVYSLDPDCGVEPGDENLKYIAGIQGTIFAELLVHPPRFPEYQVFPRMSALAEAAWTNQNLRNFDDFKERLYLSHNERLYKMGISFRVAPPIVEYHDNTLKVSTDHRSLVVRYTMDKSDPTPSSPVVRGDIVTDTPENFRFASFINDLASISVGASNIDLYNYLTPEVKVSTNIPMARNNNIAILESYDFSKYIRSETTLEKGQYVLYTFKEPVKCSKITVDTGMAVIPFYGVSNGYVEYSYDGVNFIRGNDFKLYKSVIDNITQPVKAVKIVITEQNDAYTAGFQNLKIER